MQKCKSNKMQNVKIQKCKLQKTQYKSTKEQKYKWWKNENAKTHAIRLLGTWTSIIMAVMPSDSANCRLGVTQSLQRSASSRTTLTSLGTTSSTCTTESGKTELRLLKCPPWGPERAPSLPTHSGPRALYHITTGIEECISSTQWRCLTILRLAGTSSPSVGTARRLPRFGTSAQIST